MIRLLLATALAAFPMAEPSLTVSGLRQEAGLVEFYLSGRDLPVGTKFTDIKAYIGDKVLPVTAEPISSSSTTAPKRAVVLVLDTSGSMNGTAMADARAAAQSYVSQLPPDIAVGLVSAGAPAKVVQPLTNDRAVVAAEIDKLAAQGETAVYDAVLGASGLMSAGEWGQRRIVVLTDGADTASKATPESLREIKIPVDLIAFRTADTQVTALATLAAVTGGESYAAGNATALSTAFAKAAGSFSTQSLVRVTIPPELSGQQARIRIAAGGIETAVTLQLAVDTRATGPLTGTEAPRPGIASILIIGGLVFAGLLVFALLVVSPVFSTAERRKRLAQVEQFTVPKPKRAAESTSEVSSQVAQAALALSAQVVKSTHAEGRIAQQLDRAGMRLRPHEWLLLRAIVALGLGLLLGIFLNPFWGLLLGGLLGVIITSLYHRNRATRRFNTFNEMLPDALQLVIGSLRAGFSLIQALDAMVRELPDPISTEFGRALGETRLGVDVEDALEHLAIRTRNKDLAWAVVAIRVQREVGGNLAEVLGNTVETIRERESLRRHVRALSAEGRLSAWILLALPVGVGAFMLAFRGEYLRPLYTHPIGIVMSLVGLLLVAVGGFWLSRLVKVEV